MLDACKKLCSLVDAYLKGDASTGLRSAVIAADVEIKANESLLRKNMEKMENIVAMRKKQLEAERKLDLMRWAPTEELCDASTRADILRDLNLPNDVQFTNEHRYMFLARQRRLWAEAVMKEAEHD